MGFVLLIPLLILMWVVLVRPQQQRVRRQRELITSIDVDDEVVTAGGIVGRIVEMADDRVFLEVADDVVIEVLRIAITRRLDDGDYPGPPEQPESEADTEVADPDPADRVPSDQVTPNEQPHAGAISEPTAQAIEEPAKPHSGSGDAEAPQ